MLPLSPRSGTDASSIAPVTPVAPERTASHRGARTRTTGHRPRTERERGRAGTVNVMRDRDVRAALHRQLLDEHADQLGSTLFVDELGLCGEARVDVAVVNAALSGFELKSEADTLRRFPAQIGVYSRVLDYCTLVVAESHLDHALELLPPWWGCSVVRWDGTQAWLDELRPGEFNPGIDPYALAQLLWWDEVFAALETADAARGMRSKPRTALWRRLSEVTDLPVLREIVRDALKARTRWRSATTSARFGSELAAHGAMSRF